RLCCLFFFSSRRRHTRFSRDWSSDVCSSDLSNPYNRRFGFQRNGSPASRSTVNPRLDSPGLLFLKRKYQLPSGPGKRVLESGLRSEEPRVGKRVVLGWRRIITVQ